MLNVQVYDLKARRIFHFTKEVQYWAYYCTAPSIRTVFVHNDHSFVLNQSIFNLVLFLRTNHYDP